MVAPFSSVRTRRRTYCLWLIVWACKIVACIHSVAAEPADSPAPPFVAERPLPEAARLKLQQRIQLRAAKERLAAVKELGEYPYDLEAVKLIAHSGLRDQSELVSSAAAQAILESRRSPAVGLFLVERLEQEFGAKKRPQADYVQRLLAVIGRFRFPEVYKAVLKLAEGGDAPTAHLIIESVMYSIDQAARDQDATILPILEGLSTSKAFGHLYGLRRCVIDAAVRLRSPDAISFLVKQMKALEGELRFTIVQHLRSVSQQQLAASPDLWEEWWTTHQATFKFPENFSNTTKFVEDGTPLYYDLPIHAKRLVFVLDTSQSMEAADPALMITRLEAAKRELVGAIDQLPEDTLFNVVVFNSKVGVWQDRLAPATLRWKMLAKGYVVSQRATGKTATYDALQAAFNTDSNVEAIYLLSDGAPSAGAVIPPQMILDAIQKQNRARRVTINSIGVYGGGDETHAPFMKALADLNAGQYRRAN